MDKMKQLEEWVKGNSIHDTEIDECCPDFSCCCPDLLADEIERIAFHRFFVDGNQEACLEMLSTFMCRLCQFEGYSCHTVGLTEPGEA